ncbi:rod-binding protein [Yoonia sp.]|uniref:rod-binding protein n=1 Tax=Yoonia sp. TaxID=2212373 RepID=UPI003F6D91E3
MTTIPVLPAPRGATALPDYVKTDVRLRDAAQKMEATFLAEMLKSAGLGAARQAFGGGAGEDQFTSFLRDEQARAMVEAGGIGLAQSLFEAMKVRMDV